MPSRRPMLIRAFLVGAAVLAVTTGCGDDGPSAESETAGSSAQAPTAEADKAATAITLEVTADKIHAVQPGDEIRITVSVTGFALDGTKVGTGAVSGSGHYHVYLGDAQGESLLVSAEGSAIVKVPVQSRGACRSALPKTWSRVRPTDTSPTSPARSPAPRSSRCGGSWASRSSRQRVKCERTPRCRRWPSPSPPKTPPSRSSTRGGAVVGSLGREDVLQVLVGLERPPSDSTRHVSKPPCFR